LIATLLIDSFAHFLIDRDDASVTESLAILCSGSVWISSYLTRQIVPLFLAGDSFYAMIHLLLSCGDDPDLLMSSSAINTFPVTQEIAGMTFAEIFYFLADRDDVIVLGMLRTPSPGVTYVVVNPDPSCTVMESDLLYILSRGKFPDRVEEDRSVPSKSISLSGALSLNQIPAASLFSASGPSPTVPQLA
jgi:hypothetical protein